MQERESKFIENIVNTILSKDESKKYFIHRTAIPPVFYDDSNGKLYTSKEYDEMMHSNYKDSEYADNYLYAIDGLDAKQLRENHILDHGLGWTISEQEYKQVVERNFREQISAFFEKGLYTVETSLERTATSLEGENLHTNLPIDEQRKKLIEDLNKVGFGMNTSKDNSLLGALSNREELNTLLVLEIPTSCFGDLEHITKLFEKSNEVFEAATAYRGVIKLDTVVPKEYIKGAFYTEEDSIQYTSNQNYNRDKSVENGVYNNKTINTILRNMQNSEEVQGKQVEEILEVIKSDFSIDNDIGKINNRVETVSELLLKVKDKETIESLNMAIDEIYRNIRNPLENEFYKLQTLDFTQLTPDDVAKQIQEFVLTGSNTIKELREKEDYSNFDKMFEMYKNGLEKLSKDALVQLSSDYRFNNANAMVKGKLAYINEVSNLSIKLKPLDEAEIFGELKESDRETYNTLLEQLDEAKAKVCENSIENLQKRAFLKDDIGKATINVPIALKDGCQEQIKKDQKEIETAKNEYYK